MFRTCHQCVRILAGLWRLDSGLSASGGLVEYRRYSRLLRLLEAVLIRTEIGFVLFDRFSLVVKDSLSAGKPAQRTV